MLLNAEYVCVWAERGESVSDSGNCELLIVSFMFLATMWSHTCIILYELTEYCMANDDEYDGGTRKIETKIVSDSLKELRGG